MLEGHHVLLGRGPRGADAREVAAVGQGLPDAVAHLVRQALMPGLIEGHKRQVGRRVHGDHVPRTLKGFANAGGRLDGGLADRQVEAILEKRLELHAQEAPLRQERAVLLHVGDELADRPALGDDHGLAEEGATLGAADVEDVGQARQVGQRHVVGGRGQRVGEARAIGKKLQVALATHGGELLELLQRIEGAVLGGLRNIDEGGGDHVVARAVALPRRVDAFDIGRADLAVDGGGVEDFVAAALDDAGLVHVDVAGVGGDDALPGQEDRVDDGGVRLGAADQEVHVGVGGLAGLADQVAGTLAVLVGAVSAGLLHVRGDESLEHPGVRTLLVIAGKVRQRMGRTHAAIIPRAWPDDSRFLMKIFSSWNRGTILTVAGRCCRASQYESEGIA